MQLSKVPLSESKHEPWEEAEDPKAMKRNVQLFKKEVEREIHALAARHSEEVKRLCGRIQEQARIIEKYEQRFGKLESMSPPKKENYQNKSMLSTPSPKKPSHNLLDSQLINTTLQSPPQPQSPQHFSSILTSPIPPISHQQISLNLDCSFDAPPDQLYKSRYEQRSRLKKQTQHEIYKHLKENKAEVEQKTQRLLEMVGEREKKVEVEEEEEGETEGRKKKVERRVRDRDEELNSSLSFICDSLERSKEKVKKRMSVRPVRKQENPEEEKKKESKQRLNYILRQMRDKISVKESPKKQQIKTSKLLTTGHPGGTSKVMINPVAVDLARKNESRGESSPLTKTISGSILKNSSEGRYSKTIDGLSAITKQSVPSGF